MLEPEDSSPDHDEIPEMKSASLDWASAESSQSAPLSADELSRAFAQLMHETDVDVSAGADDLTQSPDSREHSSSDSEGSEACGARVAEDTTPVSPQAILEAMLFVGHPNNVPLTSRLLASFMRGVSPTEIDELVVDLNDGYTAQQAAYQIVSEGDGYRMTLRDDLSHVRNGFYGKIKEIRLSQSAVDVLSIVAYNQPAERKMIEKVFGKPVGGILGQLVRRDLLTLETTAERPRKTIYRTTDRFLRFFGLESVDDLPRSDDF